MAWRRSLIRSIGAAIVLEIMPEIPPVMKWAKKRLRSFVGGSGVGILVGLLRIY